MANPEPDPQERLPKQLEQRLRQSAYQPVFVSRQRDEQVLRATSERLRQQFGRAKWRTRVLWAAAALIILGIFAWSVIDRGILRNGLTRTAQFAGNPGDLDGDGRVTIFDAFLLARGLRDGRIDGAWDINRDGAVNERDVSLIAQRAVHLETGQPYAAVGRSSFRVVDVFVDPKGKPFAAYQFEWSIASQNGRIVGVEGGSHSEFKTLPQYDPRAIRRQNLIAGAFSTKAGKTLPHDKIRVASIHIEAAPGVTVRFEVKAEAVDRTGRRIPVEASTAERKPR